MNDYPCSDLPVLPRLLTLDEVAEFLGIARRTVNDWAAEGRLPVIHIGPRSPRITEPDLAEFIEELRSR